MDHHAHRPETALKTSTALHECRADGAGPGGIVVGVQATDGVLLAADTRTSRDKVVESDEGRKLRSVHPSAAIGSTAEPGDVDSLVTRLRREVDRYEYHHSRRIRIQTLATVAGRECRAHLERDTTFILGGVDETGSHVFRIGVDDGVIESDYAADGSGRQSASAILDRDYTDSLSLGDARNVVASAIESAVERDPQTGPAVDIAAIRETEVAVRRYESTDAVRTRD